MGKTNNAPVKVLRVGALKASIWKNEADRKTFFNVTFIRSYKPENGDWKESDSYGHSDLLELEKLTGLAWRWIHAEREKERDAAKQEAGR